MWRGRGRAGSAGVSGEVVAVVVVVVPRRRQIEWPESNGPACRQWGRLRLSKSRPRRAPLLMPMSTPGDGRRPHDRSAPPTSPALPRTPAAQHTAWPRVLPAPDLGPKRQAARPAHMQRADLCGRRCCAHAAVCWTRPHASWVRVAKSGHDPGRGMDPSQVQVGRGSGMTRRMVRNAGPVCCIGPRTTPSIAPSGLPCSSCTGGYYIDLGWM
jgi:hypothetical protein